MFVMLGHKVEFVEGRVQFPSLCACVFVTLRPTDTVVILLVLL